MPRLGGYLFKRITGVLSICLSFLLVLWLISGIDKSHALVLIKQAEIEWLLIAFILISFSPLFMTWRWLGTLCGLPGERLSFNIAFRAVLTAIALNSFLPMKGGDVAKALVSRKYYGLSAVIGSVLLERFVDLGLIGLLAAVALLKEGTGLSWVLLGLVPLCISSTLFLLALWAPLERWSKPVTLCNSLRNFRQVCYVWIHTPKAVIITVGSSLVCWLIALCVFVCLARALDPTFPYSLIVTAFPIGIVAGLVPVTVSGLGTRDATFAVLLSSRFGQEKAVLLALGYTLIAYWYLSILAGVLLLLVVCFKKKYKSKTIDIP